MVPFLEDLPAANIEELILFVGDLNFESQFDMHFLKINLSPLQYLRRFYNVQVVTLDLDLEGFPLTDRLDIVLFLLSHLSDHSPLRLIRILIFKKHTLDDSSSPLDTQPCFAALHDKFPNVTLDLGLEPHDSQVSPSHIAGVDNSIRYEQSSPIWFTRQQITDD